MTLESVKLDLLGDQHFDFEEAGFRLVAQGYARLRLPEDFEGRAITWNHDFAYHDIEWVRVLRRRQWGMLLPAALVLPTGVLGSIILIGEWGPMSVCLMWTLVLGVFPLVVFLRGRAYLGIASRTHIVVLPLDRKRKALRRILGLLKQQLPVTVPWDMTGTAFEDVSKLDNRPPSGKGFDQRRHTAIALLLGLHGLSNLLAHVAGFYWFALALQSGVIVTELVLIARWAWREANWG